MHVLPPYHRILLLTEGQLGVFSSKTAASLLRYRRDDIVAVVDSQAAGKKVADFIPWAPPVPIVPDIAATAQLHPDALFIGVAPVGGALPDDMRPPVVAALSAGIDVVSGMHSFLNDDAEFAALAARRGVRLFDLRRPPSDLMVASGQALHTLCRRVLTVGTDCNVGKMVAALELTAAARRRGANARFLATGQTGIMIDGRGISVDACVADFTAGAVEQLVLDAVDSDICFVEGQGSIGHPGYSAVTLALLHGACPDALVLVHQLGRTHYKAPPNGPLPDLRHLIEVYEQVAGLMQPARVVAVAVNSVGQTDDTVRAATAALEDELELPVADPVRAGCDRIIDAVLGR